MSDEIPECQRGRSQHSWCEPELADIEWGEHHEHVHVRLACGECECVIERDLSVGSGPYHRSSDQLVLPPLAVCEIEECGGPIWKEGYEHHGDYYCTSSYKEHNFLCDYSPEYRVWREEQNARRRAEAKAKKEASE